MVEFVHNSYGQGDWELVCDRVACEKEKGCVETIL